MNIIHGAGWKARFLKRSLTESPVGQRWFALAQNLNDVDYQVTYYFRESELASVLALPGKRRQVILRFGTTHTSNPNATIQRYWNEHKAVWESIRPNLARTYTYTGTLALAPIRMVISGSGRGGKNLVLVAGNRIDYTPTSVEDAYFAEDFGFISPPDGTNLTQFLNLELAFQVYYLAVGDAGSPVRVSYVNETTWTVFVPKNIESVGLKFEGENVTAISYVQDPWY